jgi:hypothetical protein
MFKSICPLLLIALVCSGAGAGIATAQTTPQSVNAEGVHVVLLAANAKTPAKYQRELPPSVAKALKDASQFLPFTYYEVLDQVSLRGAGVNQKIRLQGLAKAQEFQLTLSTRPSASAGSGDRTSALPPNHPDRIAASARAARDAQDRVAVNFALVEISRLGLADATSDVMATEYGARIGETVVVGTSQLKSDVSIVLLITVLPPNSN